MTTAYAKKKIASFINDIGNKGIGAEYRAHFIGRISSTDRLLFVKCAVLDELELPATESLVNYAEDILGDAT